jgi:hypothetical protein
LRCAPWEALDAVEAVTLHDTGETLALGGAGDVDGRARLEGVRGELLAGRVLGRVGADLDEVAARGHAGLLEVAGQRLVDLAGVDRAEGDLDGGIAVGLGRADLRDDAGPDLDHGDRNEAVVLVPDWVMPSFLPSSP